MDKNIEYHPCKPMTNCKETNMGKTRLNMSTDSAMLQVSSCSFYWHIHNYKIEID